MGGGYLKPVHGHAYESGSGVGNDLPDDQYDDEDDGDESGSKGGRRKSDSNSKRPWTREVIRHTLACRDEGMNCG